MEKAAAYKRKQNLEIPKTFKGKSLTNTNHTTLFAKMSKTDICIGGSDTNRHKIIDDLIAGEKEICLAFANNNPEIVLPDNLEFDPSDLVSTPNGAPLLEPVGTADASRGTPMVLTKVKPCGLSHPFKIN